MRQLQVLLDAGTPVVTIVGKTWLLHVGEILRTTPEENLAMIEDSARHLAAQGREVVYDAEHFFDGYRDDPEYAMRTLAAATRGGAANLTLCDTNGGSLVGDFSEVVARVVREFGADRVGVHCHNDSGLGVALSLAGVAAGATLVQGTINGYGERTGNADLTTILPTSSSRWAGRRGAGRTCRTCGSSRTSSTSWRTSGPIRSIRSSGRPPSRTRAACMPTPPRRSPAATSTSIPATVGNRTRVLVSDLAGRSSLVMKARELGFALDEHAPELKAVLDTLKQLEFQGYEFEAADASLRLLLAKSLGQHVPAFEFESYRVIIERRGPEASIVAEATVKLTVKGKRIHTVAECVGPISALDKALRLALERAYPAIKDTALSDYKVRILGAQRGSNSRTRVLIETTDGSEIWGTVGVSDNIIEASWEALRDAVEYKLLLEEKKAQADPPPAGP